MLLMPLRRACETDPEDVIREIEDDRLSQFVWSLAPAMRKAANRLSDSLSNLFRRPLRSQNVNC